MKICSKQFEIKEDIKAKLESIAKNRIITYLPGSFIKLEGTNINCINPSKAIIKNGNKELVLLFYCEYYQDEDAFFLYDIKHKYTWGKLKKLLA